MPACGDTGEAGEGHQFPPPPPRPCHCSQRPALTQLVSYADNRALPMGMPHQISVVKVPRLTLSAPQTSPALCSCCTLAHAVPSAMKAVFPSDPPTVIAHPSRPSSSAPSSRKPYLILSSPRWQGYFPFLSPHHALPSPPKALNTLP